MKMPTKAKKLKLKLEAEINAKKLIGKRLRGKKNLPCDELLFIYDLLWVPFTPSMDLIQRRFECFALCIHPDKRGDTEKFKQLNQIECVFLDNGA